MIPHFDPTRFIIEIVFAGVISTLCFLIFFNTREMYNLTKHKGIGFFRSTFLMFGFAHIFSFLFAISHLVRDPVPPHMRNDMLMPILILFTSFLSTLAIIFLLYSTVWKKYKKHTNLLIITAGIIALITSLTSFLFRSEYIMLIFQAAIFIVILLINIKSYLKKKKVSKLFYIYILLFVFWLINQLLITPRNHFFDLHIKIFSQLISIIIFGIIYYKVSKWT